MSLTDDWKAGKLKNGWYFCLYENDAVFPALCFDDDFDDYVLKVTEVLAPCDFDHFVELTEKVKKFEKKNQTENIKLRKLLEECRFYIVNTAVLEQGSEQKTKIIHELLTRINEVLK